MPSLSLHSSLSALRAALVGAGLAACTAPAPFRHDNLGATAPPGADAGAGALATPAGVGSVVAPANPGGGAGGGAGEAGIDLALPIAGGPSPSASTGGAAGSAASASDAGVPATVTVNCDLPSEPAIPPLRLSQIAADLAEPIYITPAPGDDTRLFVIEKPGRIRVIRAGELLPEPFLDITDRVETPVQEMGLLGLAFHPRYAENGLFYLTYSTDSQGGINPPNSEVLAEFHARDAEHAERDERRLLTVVKPEGNHNGGTLQFRADGYLYLGVGDGGGAGDQHGSIGNGQALDTLLGKMLRIDVNGRGAGPDGQYAIPSGNFSERASEALPEIWSVGLRNPWRFSFDPCTSDLYIGDVGQERQEEVDFVPGTEFTGRNFGWRLMEADECFTPDDCNAAAQGLTLPIASYGRMTGQSITGGYVYRGSALPELRGAYLYADYQSAAFFALRVQAGALVGEPSDITANINPGKGVDDITSFGQDNDGELYVTTFTGQVFRIDPGAEALIPRPLAP